MVNIKYTTDFKKRIGFYRLILKDETPLHQGRRLTMKGRIEAITILRQWKAEVSNIWGYHCRQIHLFLWNTARSGLTETI